MSNVGIVEMDDGRRVPLAVWVCKSPEAVKVLPKVGREVRNSECEWVTLIVTEEELKFSDPPSSSVSALESESTPP
ncbi:hypothetical protein LINPERHAP1_LOCUS28940 [Linum perenne]